MNAARSDSPHPSRRVRLRLPRGRIALLLGSSVAVAAITLGFALSGGDRDPASALDPMAPREPPSPFAASEQRPSGRADSPQPSPAFRSLPEQDAAAGATQFPVYDESVVKLAEAHQLPAEISGAADADVRASALRQIDAASSADSFALLEQTLQTDKAVRNRLLAVNSLRLLGKQPDNRARARAALRMAMSDTDENVVTSARDAYAELER